LATIFFTDALGFSQADKRSELTRFLGYVTCSGTVARDSVGQMFDRTY
jgi:hypothetical protein